MTNIQIRDDDDRWERFIARDRTADGVFFTGVATTGIYCRPSCPARKPKRENVRFYDAIEAAERDGYRACLRCKPDTLASINPDQVMIHKICEFVSGVDTHLPTLEELSEVIGVSPSHLQRRFKAIMGISPRAYADEKRRQRFRTMLRDGDGVTDALYGAGYGSSSRLYEQADTWLGMTPASYAKGGKGVIMHYAITDTPLGRMIVAATGRGISFLGFGDDDEGLIMELCHDFPEAEISPGEQSLHDCVAVIVRNFDSHTARLGLPLDMQGTAFQAKVWQALQDIPPGETRTYREIAVTLGKPEAARAVGRACATNPVSLVVPCHRAMGSDGSLTGYRWGVSRKRTLLDRENTGK